MCDVKNLWWYVLELTVTDTTLRHCLAAHLERYRSRGGGGRLVEAERLAQGARAGGVEHRVGVGRLDGGRDVGNVVGEEGLRRGAVCAVLGEVGGALEAGLPGEDAEHGHEDGAERAGGLGVVETDAVAFGQGVGVLPFAGADEALAGRAVEGVVTGVADLLEAEDELAQALGRIAERVGVALGRGCPALAFRLSGNAVAVRTEPLGLWLPTGTCEPTLLSCVMGFPGVIWGRGG